MRRSPMVLALLLALTACQVPVETPTPESSGKRLERTPPKASATPSVAPSGPASAAPSTAPSVSPSTAASLAPAVSLLQKPGGASRLVTGTVAIDAHYGHAAGGGRLVSNNGARAISFGAAQLVGNNGSNVVSNNGSSLIGKVKAPISGLVSNNGSGLISDKGNGYRTLQATAPTLGEILPAAGLALRVFSLRTGELLPLGVDGAGQPVYEVYSDATGAYQLYLPESEINNVLLQAIVPGTTDDRLDYNLVVPKNDAKQTLDEDTSLVADFIRKAFADVLRQDIDFFLKAYKEDGFETAIGLNFDKLPEFLHEPARQTRTKLFTAGLKAGVETYSETQKLILAQRLNDTILTYLDLNAIQTEYKTYGVTTPETPALPALVSEFRQSRETVTKAFQRFETEKADPATFFAGRPYMQTVKDTLGLTFTVKTPTDAIAFMAFGVMANVQIERPEAQALYEEIVTTPEYGMPAGSANRMFAAAQPFYSAYLAALYLKPEVSDAVVKVMEAGVPAP